MPIKKPQPGDDVAHLAQRDGVSRQAILAHPDNRELFARRNPAVLHEQDEIFVPAPEPAKFRVRTGELHCFVYKPATRTLHLELRDLSGAVRQVDYTLSDFEFDGSPPKYGPKFPDKLYGFAYQGIVQEELPARLKRATLLLEDAPDHPVVLELGRLDPVHTLRGLKARLHNLGLYSGELDDAFDAGLPSALRAFQLSQQLPVTGQPDTETCQRLSQAHGA